jgi:SAM-dependent methyltransferase
VTGADARAGDAAWVPGARRAERELFLVSFAILFLELACIRWLGSTVIFLAYFTNLVLMASFLGMSVGCLAAGRETNWLRSVLPLTLATVLLAVGALVAYRELGRLAVDVGGQASPQQVFFGADFRALDPSRFFVPIEVVAATFFVLMALIFVGLGQTLGRAFDRVPGRVRAYSTNVLGSLAGIAGFALASALGAPPVVWFGIAALIVLILDRPVRTWKIGTAIALAAALVFADAEPWLLHGRRTWWSPYNKITFDPKTGDIDANNISHQTIIDVSAKGPGYVLPHLLNRDAGGEPFGDVLIVGAGSGNDVQGALLHGARRIDAVEIDPVINAIGRREHPDRPFSDPRVTVHLDDGRHFLRATDRSYDLVSYAVVDSLVLHSSYSSLRLESYLFTEEALRDIKKRLKPGGVFAMYNYYRQGWVVGRLAKLAATVFGSEPLVISLPHQDRIAPGDRQHGFETFLLVGNGPSPRLEAIRRALDREGSYWLNTAPRVNESIRAFGPKSPEVPGVDTGWHRVAPAFVEIEPGIRLPTDDWPFLYVHRPSIPDLNLRGMAIVALASLALLFALAPVRRVRPNGRMFFLGAGFMLLETRGVVHMALLFGSTWLVNSAVFAAILVMILLANLFVALARPVRLAPTYVLLFAALLVDGLIPSSSYLALPAPWGRVAACVVTFAPLFFAGIVFATVFRSSTRPDVDLGSNVGGAILGGLSEFASLVVGFNALLALAAVYYLLSALSGPRHRPGVD